MIKHPAATDLVRVSDNSMVNEGIHDNDLLVVDRSLKPAYGLWLSPLMVKLQLKN